MPIGRMTWLRLRWQRSSWLVRIGLIVGALVAVGLVANLVLQPAALTYAGTFTATGSMGAARAGATATLLPDGRVLVAGGTSDSEAALGSAELYDPQNGTFSATGSLVAPRVSATAVLLADGRVLIAGGNGTDGNAGIAALASAELYDPQTGTFTATGSMQTARVSCTMTVLADGRVLMAGGSNDHDRLELASAEVYDPTTGTFAAAGSMAIGREGAAAALLPDGRVLVAGGAVSVDASTGTITASAELFDPATGTFGPTGSMAMPLEWRAATLLIDGRVLVVGGRGLGSMLDGSVSAELYDPGPAGSRPPGSCVAPGRDRVPSGWSMAASSSRVTRLRPSCMTGCQAPSPPLGRWSSRARVAPRPSSPTGRSCSPAAASASATSHPPSSSACGGIIEAGPVGRPRCRCARGGGALPPTSA